MEYRYGSHTVFQIEYHFVWVTKYRYKVLTGEIAERVRELVRETRGYFCATVGQMTEEMIKQYLEHHFEPKRERRFQDGAGLSG